MQRIAIAVLLVATSARADSFQTHETFGLDLSTLWEPSNKEAFGAGPLLRFESYSTRWPERLGAIVRAGIFVDNADRMTAPLMLGLITRPASCGVYGSVEAGFMVSNGGRMEEGERSSWAASAAVGWRWRNWDLRATVMRSGVLTGDVWLFSLGRDFEHVDSQVTRTTLF